MMTSKRGLLALALVLALYSVSLATPARYWATALTGGTTSSLDSINGGTLNDEDSAIVVLPAGGAYEYTLDETSGLAESSPYIISPDTNAGNKRWICTNCGNSTQPGDVQMATNAEAAAMSLATRVITPANLGSINATGGFNGTMATGTNSSIGPLQLAPVGNSTDYTKALSPGALYDTKRFAVVATSRDANATADWSVAGFGFKPREIHVTYGEPGQARGGWGDAAENSENGEGIYFGNSATFATSTDLIVYTDGAYTATFSVKSWDSDGVTIQTTATTSSKAAGSTIYYKFTGRR